MDAFRDWFLQVLGYPATPFGLLVFIVLMLMRLHAGMVRGVVKSQKDITDVLGNHFKEESATLREISAHMATTNNELALMRDRLLDAVLSQKESRKEV